MRILTGPWLLVLPPLLLLALPACEKQDEDRRAWTLSVLPSRIADARIETMESAPPRFAVNTQIALPNPGVRVSIEEVSAPDASGRITALVRATQRPGVWPQVVTPMPLRLELGSLDEGEYVLEIFERGRESHLRPVGAVLLRAIGR